MVSRRCALGIAVVGGWLVAGTAAAEPQVPLYEIDFGTPPHKMGEPPVVGEGPFPRDTPTHLFNGEPIVVRAVGDLHDQPVLFEADEGGNQSGSEKLQLRVTSQFATVSRFVLEFDVLVDGLSPGDVFSVFLDAPSILRLVFDDDGTLRAAAPQPQPLPLLEVDIGTYTPGEVQHLRIELDTDVPEWLIFVDDVLLHRRDRLFAGLQTVRFSLSGASAGDGAIAAVDDISLTAILDIRPDVDILPGSERNRIRPQRRGEIPVAIKGSAFFDVGWVDPDSLVFGPDRAPPIRRRGVQLVDVDEDGFDDLLAFYRRAKTGIALGDAEACTTGEFTTPGPVPRVLAFGGCDAIDTLPDCGRGYELALVLPPLAVLRARRRRASVR